MGAFETFKTELLDAISAATRGYGETHYARGVKALPAIAEPDAIETWLEAIVGRDGTGGLLLDVRLEACGAHCIERKEAWCKAFDLLQGMAILMHEEVERSRASCRDCDGGEACAECGGAGVTFVEGVAA